MGTIHLVSIFEVQKVEISAKNGMRRLCFYRVPSSPNSEEVSVLRLTVPSLLLVEALLLLSCCSRVVGVVVVGVVGVVVVQRDGHGGGGERRLIW